MPHLVSLSKQGKWKEGVLTGNFADAEFGFLGSFQELLPENSDSATKSGKAKKIKNVENGKTKGENQEVVDGAKKKKKKRRKKKNKTGEVEKSKETLENAESTSGEVKLDKKKKKKKRKLEKENGSASPAKKVKFAKEIEVAEPETSEVVDAAAAADEDEESVQRIVIDDEDEEDKKDVTKPAQSSWDDLYLPEPVTKAIKELGFKVPTEIQRQVLPLAVRDRCDVLGAAETGSGKTLAYAIPMVARLLEVPEEPQSNRKGPKALILAPTRELVVQVMKHVTAVLKYTNFKAFPIVGGLAQVRQARILKEQKPEVIVATPGRLWAMMKEEEDGSHASDYLADWSGLLCLVVDETDRMVERGHFEEMQEILETVRKSATEKLQTLVFSATLTYVHHEQPRAGQPAKKELTPQQKIKELIQLTGMRTQCKIVDITRAFGTAEALVKTRINCSNLLEKDTTVVYLLERYKGRTLIFTNSIDASRRMYGILKLLKLQPLMIHAKMEQKVRLKNLEKFTADSRSILLATDVAARGLDIQGIDNVIHYQVPKTAELYIHRSGRTARASRKGLSVLLVDSKDAHLYRRLCKNLNREKDLPVFPIDCQELMRRLRTRVELASALDTLAYRSKKIRLTENWFDKMIREADLEMDDRREHEQNNANDEMNAIKSQEVELQAELRAELAEPLPNISQMNLPKTRYINPDVVAQYSKVASSSTNTLESLEERLAEAEVKKKKARKLITTHQLKAKAFKRKKKS
ncbi:unnamed protein product [Cylicocyclus nassatus]|uniref:RNA helicase n=1 Tax=Cylicocyclus nassatus TaxID=53992 RepID=A0AA36GXY0_CYLNA|nr:unnamed protein product [Cylicocyclus nassatus]